MSTVQVAAGASNAHPAPAVKVNPGADPAAGNTTSRSPSVPPLRSVTVFGGYSPPIVCVPYCSGSPEFSAIDDCATASRGPRKPKPCIATLLSVVPAIWISSDAGARRPTSEGLKRTFKTHDGGTLDESIMSNLGKPLSAWQPPPVSVYSAWLAPVIVKLDPVNTSGWLPLLNSVTVRFRTLSLSTSTPGSGGESNRLDALTIATGPGLPCN